MENKTQKPIAPIGRRIAIKVDSKSQFDIVTATFNQEIRNKYDPYFPYIILNDNGNASHNCEDYKEVSFIDFADIRGIEVESEVIVKQNNYIFTVRKDGVDISSTIEISRAVGYDETIKILPKTLLELQSAYQSLSS